MNYKDIRQICSQTSELTFTAIDSFLIQYAARQDKLNQEVQQQLLKYNHIIRKQNSEWKTFIHTQYIGHRIFKKHGLISKYLKHSALKGLTVDEMSFLQQQTTMPWRFCFSEITGNPDNDFYEMSDILSGEKFLLYSRGTTEVLRMGNRTLWFNLIAFNGACWQTFGPINGYRVFTADDIFFYATELDPALKSSDDVIQHIETNPVPYMVLFSGSEHPGIVHKNEQIIFNQAEHDMLLPETPNLKKDFTMQTVKDVTKYSLKRWDGFPHFACFYCDGRKLLLRAMTDKGFAKLAEKMNAAGISVSREPDMRVTPSMLSTAGSILNKKIKLNDYDSLFETKTNPADKESLNKLNRLIALLTPVINARKEPDIPSLAKNTGFDDSTIEDVIAQIKNAVNKMNS